MPIPASPAPRSGPAGGTPDPLRPLRIACTATAAFSTAATLAVLTLRPTTDVELGAMALGAVVALVWGVLSRAFFDRRMRASLGGRPDRPGRRTNDADMAAALRGALTAALPAAGLAAVSGVLLALLLDSTWVVVGSGPVAVSAAWSLRGQVPAGLGS